METTADFLDHLKSRLVCRNDAELAGRMGWKPAQISRYRRLQSTFSDETALRVAELCDVKPEFIVACMKAQQSKHPETRSAWQRVAEQIGRAAAFAAVAVAPALTSPDAQARFDNSQNAPTSPHQEAGRNAQCSTRRRRSAFAHTILQTLGLPGQRLAL